MTNNGFKQLKNCNPGELVRFNNGDHAVISEYRSGNSTNYDGYLLDSGECLHADPNEWVLVIDLFSLEIESGMLDGIEYPPDTKESQ